LILARGEEKRLGLYQSQDSGAMIGASL
jgi:hypothetical protein